MYAYDSRKVKQGDIFLCLPGGQAYCDEALSNGAKDIMYVSRKEMAALANSWFSFPSKELMVIGVTGTNGKTSVCHFVTEALNEMGKNAFFQGTLSHSLTTPESLDTFRNMRLHLDNLGTHFVMEVSSHGIAQARVEEIAFDVKCLTNVTQDHLDFHGSMDAYRQVKYDFMDHLSCFKIYPDDFHGLNINVSQSSCPSFEILNKQAALAILVACGFDYDQSLHVLKGVSSPKGRFEQVISNAPFHVIVDYAHSPDGVEGVLRAARNQESFKKGNVLVCYGCGGDRDRKKRSLMASVVSRLSDYSVITMDNPRTEDPHRIIEDMMPGISKEHTYDIILDRKEAIKTICLRAKPDDVVLIVGKGHESYQLIGQEMYPFSDVDVSKDVLRDMGY
ncbi:hypothetical protein CL658_05435 [bacterium]|nr:hypothetical protein [bacterium]|tara:strand:- start:155 stop:1327 length:1173 start_codon:yes stop_codon:yes gene_type:complete